MIILYNITMEMTKTPSVEWMRVAWSTIPDTWTDDSEDETAR
jgi:hypothetical protein